MQRGFGSSFYAALFELDGAAGLRGKVVQNTADAVDLGGNAVADPLEERPIKLRPVSYTHLMRLAS